MYMCNMNIYTHDYLIYYLYSVYIYICTYTIVHIHTYIHYIYIIKVCIPFIPTQKKTAKVSPSRHPSLPAHSQPHKPRWWCPQGSQSPENTATAPKIYILASRRIYRIYRKHQKTIVIPSNCHFNGKNTDNPMDLELPSFKKNPCVSLFTRFTHRFDPPNRFHWKPVDFTTIQCHKLRPRREVCQQWFSQQRQMISWRSVR